MGYTVYFIGLVNFFDLKPQGRLILLPDGREPSKCPSELVKGIRKHKASFVVKTKSVIDASDWWPESVDTELKEYGLSEFPIAEPSTITIGGIHLPPRKTGCLSFKGSDALDTRQHAKFLPRLKEINPAFNIVPPKAATIAQIPVRRGKLKAYLLDLEPVQGARPRYIAHQSNRKEPVENAAAVSELVIRQHSGDITITAFVDDGVQVKTLVIENGAEIFLANIGERNAPETNPNHFALYAQLDEKRDATNLDKEPDLVKMPNFESQHDYVVHIIKGEGGAVPAPGCSNSGCCQE